MKINLCVFKILFFIYLVLSQAAYAKDSDKLPKSIKLDDKVWKLDWQKEDNNILVGEYVTNDESVDNWTQLFTYQYFKDSTASSPKQLAEFEIDAFKNHGYKDEYYKIIESSDKEVIFEFRISKPTKDIQDEIQRIIKGPKNTYIVLHYVVKKPDMGEAERSKWIQIMQGMKLHF